MQFSHFVTRVWLIVSRRSLDGLMTGFFEVYLVICTFRVGIFVEPVWNCRRIRISFDLMEKKYLCIYFFETQETSSEKSIILSFRTRFDSKPKGILSIYKIPKSKIKLNKEKKNIANMNAENDQFFNILFLWRQSKITRP